MPVKLIQEAEEAEVEVTTVDEAPNPFVNEDGDPTLEARAISDFLTHADFGAIFEHPEAIPQLLTLGEASKVTAYAASLTEMPKNGKHKGKGMFKKKNGNGNGDDDADDDDDDNGNGNGKHENVSNSVKAGATQQSKGKEMHDGDGPLGKSPKTGKTYPAAGNKAESVDFEESTLYPEFATALAEAGGAMHHCEAHKGMKKGKMSKMPYAEAALAERGSGDIYSKSGVKKGASAGAQVGNDDAGKGHRPMQSGAKVESLVQFLDGALAAQLIDEKDLVSMFAHYCDGLVENVDESDTPLTAKAQLALLSEMFGIENGTPFKKSKTTEDVAKMLVAMLSESVVKHVPEGKAGKRLTAAMRESNLSTFKAAARRAVRGESADEELSLEEVPVFGIASPVGEAAFEVGANAKAKLTIEPAPEQTDEETDDETVEPGKKIAAEAVRVVNHAGSGRTGPQLVTEMARQAGRSNKVEKPAEQSSTVTESETPKKPAAKRSSGASLAAGMVKAQQR